MDEDRKKVKTYRAMMIAAQQLEKFDPTQAETIGMLEERMAAYLQKHPEIWDDVKPLGAGEMP